MISLDAFSKNCRKVKKQSTQTEAAALKKKTEDKNIVQDSEVETTEILYKME